MSTDRMIKFLNDKGFNFTKNNCCICYENFIDNISFVELLKLSKKFIDDDDFWGENPVRCYNDRFECITCRNIVCDTCIQNIPQEDGATGDFITKFTCPICRKEDFRYQINGKYLPVEILREIKNRHIKCPKV